MGTKLTDKEVKEVEDAFAMYSKNGSVKADEVILPMRVLNQNPTNEEAKAMVTKYDVNKNGAIELDEFKAMFTSERKTSADMEKIMKDAFLVFDKDNKGIEAEKLKTILTTMGDKLTKDEADQMIKEADKNKDGKISYEEYKSTILV